MNDMAHTYHPYGSGDFKDWLKDASPGDRCIYHVGHLAADRLKDQRVNGIARVALNSAGYRYGRDPKWRTFIVIFEHWKVQTALAQKRVDGGFEYWAVKL